MKYKTTVMQSPELMTVICNIQDMMEQINGSVYDRHKEFRKRLSKLSSDDLHTIQDILIQTYNKKMHETGKDNKV